MKYLITGGCGFIGSHIAEELVKDGAEVRVYDDLSSGYKHNIEAFADRVEFIEADVRDAERLVEASRDVDGIFHEAALVSVFESVEKPEANHEINITGTMNVLQAARKNNVKRVLVASSAAIYGNDPALPKREDMLPVPESPYALAKICDEHYLSVFHKLYGIETVSLRYFNVYGPRQDPSSMYSGVISKFNDVLAKGEQPTIFGDGLQSRDFVFVKDVARANLLAMRSDRVGKGEVFNIATGRRVDLLELLETLGKVYGLKPEPVFKEARKGDVKHSQADVSKAGEVLGYEPKYSLLDGLKALAGR
jgi:UDP-glucose 4-epimerase